MELDFQDYTPKGDATSQDDPSQEPQIQIKIPDSGHVPGHQSGRLMQSPSGSNPVLSALQNIVNLSSSSGMSEESLRQMVAATIKQRQNQPGTSTSSGGYWGFGYFAQYFDVTTSEVLQRIIWSALPLRVKGVDLDSLNEQELMAPLASSSSSNSNDNSSKVCATKQRSYSYVERFIQSRPDFYGPFWISTTLVFAIAIFSNIVSFYNYRSKIEKLGLAHLNDKFGDSSKSIEELSNELGISMDSWHYSMEELNLATSAVMVYSMVLPTLLWFLFWVRGCTKYYTLTETICAYGYSMSIFVPISAIFMIQSTIIRYLFLTTASILSGLVLTMSFFPVIKTDPKAGSSHIILAIIPACVFGFAYILHRIMLQ